jgi:hypothetical protein
MLIIFIILCLGLEHAQQLETEYTEGGRLENWKLPWHHVTDLQTSRHHEE